MRAHEYSCSYGCDYAAFQLLTAYQIPENFYHTANCLAQLVNIARCKARDPGDIPPIEDVKYIMKYSKALLSVISAWEATYKKEVKAAGSPAAFGHTHEKSSKLHMEHLKV
jgi:hypothetical protein